MYLSPFNLRQANGDPTRLCLFTGNACFEKEMAKAASEKCDCLMDCETTSYGYSVTVEELKEEDFCNTREEIFFLIMKTCIIFFSCSLRQYGEQRLCGAAGDREGGAQVQG